MLVAAPLAREENAMTDDFVHKILSEKNSSHEHGLATFLISFSFDFGVDLV